MNKGAVIGIESIPIVTLNHISLTNTTLESSSVRWIRINGMHSTVSLTQINATNVDFYAASAINFANPFLSIMIKEMHFDNVTVASDISIIRFNSLQVLDMRDLEFSNIASQSAESGNNYMISIAKTGKSHLMEIC